MSKKSLFKIIATIISLFCFNVPTFAEMTQNITPGVAADTVIWETPVNLTGGKNGTLQLVCAEDVINEDTNAKGKLTDVEGRFELRLIDADKRTMSVNNDLFGFAGHFPVTNFEIFFDDYNSDGCMDFALGQPADNGWAYKIFTVKNDKILALPIENQASVMISGGGYYSRRLDTGGLGGFCAVEYEGYTPDECVIKTYAWDGTQFFVSEENTQPLVQITDISDYFVPLLSDEGTPYKNEEAFLYSQEGVQFRKTAYGAAKALLTADAESLARHLVNPGSAVYAVRHLTDIFDEITLMTFKFSFEDSVVSEKEIITSYEFATKNDDSYSYVSMTLLKIDGVWKVSFIGLEK